jgi:hypothetical protein
MQITQVIIQVGEAHPDRGDPGAVEVGYYSVEGDMLTMCDENGRPVAKPRRLQVDEDPHIVAGRLTRERWLKTNDASNFNRRLNYGPLGIA